MFHTPERAFGYRYPWIRTPEAAGLAGRAGGGDVQGDELGGVAQQHGELADHTPGDDVEVVVAVLLAGVGAVVVADDDDVVGGLFPEDAAGELRSR